MCGRYSLQTPLPDLAEIFAADVALEDPGPRFNVAPTETIAAIRASERGRTLSGLRWGLVPSWSRGPTEIPLIINARSESLETKPAFRDLLADHRCIVPADGFYEWRAERGLRQPYFVRRRDRAPLALAGLWDRWGVEESCAIVTTDSNSLLVPLHDRMPVLLAGEQVDRWVDPRERDFERLRDLLRPSPSDLLELYPVSTRVNRVGQDDPVCIEPAGRSITSPDDWADRPPAGIREEDDQLGLF